MEMRLSPHVKPFDPSSPRPPGSITPTKSIDLKITIVGAYAVGKSSLAHRYVNGRFNTMVSPTVGACFFTKSVLVDSTIVRMLVWDTAGSERYNALMPLYIRGSHAIVVCFEAPNNEKRVDIPAIIELIGDIRKTTKESPIILAATKVDEFEPTAYAEVSTFARENGYLLYFTSSKTGLGVDDLFAAVAREGLDYAKGLSTTEFELVEAPKSKAKWCC
jgi:small GTP-binding protein